MEVEITLEKQFDQNVYFEIEPIPNQYKNKLKFCIEKTIDINDQKKMESLRIELMNLANDEFEKMKNDL
jgi:hypothetical protein